MAIRKRFIAGAKCPVCQAQDSMAMWRENNIDIVECVKKQTKKLAITFAKMSK